MDIRFQPNEAATGICSFASWANEDLLAAIRQAFHESPRERIVRVDVTRDGMRAYFESRNTCGTQ